MSCNKNPTVIEMIDEEENLFLFLQYGSTMQSISSPTGRPVFNNQRLKQRENSAWRASAKIERTEKVYAKDPTQMSTKPTGAGVFPSPSFIPYVFEYVAREYTGYGVRQYD